VDGRLGILPRPLVTHAAVGPSAAQSETFKVMERRLLNAIMTSAAAAFVNGAGTRPLSAAAAWRPVAGDGGAECGWRAAPKRTIMAAAALDPAGARVVSSGLDGSTSGRSHQRVRRVAVAPQRLARGRRCGYLRRDDARG
jgi:hypothetical protein